MITRPLLVDNPVDGHVGSKPLEPVAQGNVDPSVPYPLWKLPTQIEQRTLENYLFNRAEDPGQKQNLWDHEPKQRERMLGLLRASLEEEGYPQEQLKRLGIEDVPLSLQGVA